jgi:hypothetical protein
VLVSDIDSPSVTCTVAGMLEDPVQLVKTGLLIPEQQKSGTWMPMAASNVDAMRFDELRLRPAPKLAAKLKQRASM